MRRPNLFLIGAPKSGTTSLYEYVRGHPEVYMSPMKEPFYFAPDVVSGPRRRALRYGEDEAAYLALFEDARDERWVGEASTGYMVSEVAASLIGQFAPAARMIAMVRNPVEVVHALHSERVSHGVEDLPSLEDALAAEPDRRAARRLPPGSTPLGATYLGAGRFGEQLRRWIDQFGRERVHVIVFDDFAGDTPACFRRVLEFLEIDSDYRPASFAVHNPSHRMRGGVVGALRRGRAGRALRRLAARLIGERRATRLAREVRHSRVTRATNERQPLSAEFRERLEEEFAADVGTLSEIVGRDLARLWFRRQSAGTP